VVSKRGSDTSLQNNKNQKRDKGSCLKGEWVNSKHVGVVSNFQREAEAVRKFHVVLKRVISKNPTERGL
jgi:hypothetical protein